MRSFRDSRKTLFAFHCFLEGHVHVHTACVCLQVCVYVGECAGCVCGTLSGRTVFPGEGSRGCQGELDIASTQFVEQLLHLWERKPSPDDKQPWY